MSPLYFMLGVIASFFSGFKIIETRRRLQLQRGLNAPRVTFVDAAVNTLFDVLDKFALEANRVNTIVEQRRQAMPAITYNEPNRLLLPPSSSPPQQQPLPHSRSIHPSFSSPAPQIGYHQQTHRRLDPLESIPDNRVHHNRIQ